MTHPSYAPAWIQQREQPTGSHAERVLMLCKGASPTAHVLIPCEWKEPFVQELTELLRERQAALLATVRQDESA